MVCTTFPPKQVYLTDQQK